MKEAIPFGNMEITGVDAVARLKWERKLLKELYPLHSAYPKILDEFTCDNHEFIIIEDRGKSLKELIFEKGKFSVSLSVQIIQQIAEAVHVAHQKNIILRDLSPNNILLNGKQVTLIDLEYSYRPDGPPLSSIGTPGFSLKEQMNPRITPEIPSATNDIYSIGAIWHTLLSPDSYIKFITQKMDKSNAWERSDLPKECSDEIRRIIERCLCKNGYRYLNINSFIQDLKKYTKSEGRALN